MVTEVRWQPPTATEFLEVEDWRGVPGYADYEVSDMGRVRCLKDRKGGFKAPFILTTALSRPGRPMVTLRNESGQKSRRVDELVLEAFTGPRPASDWGPVPTNGDRRDVRADNLSWVEGIVKPVKARSVVKRRKAIKKAPIVKVPSQIRHGHWLGVGNVLVSILPTQVIELTVADSPDHHAIPLSDLEDVIRVLQAAKTIIEG
jgi:hypothetical protein